jgi:FkbM family methyltransferase
LCRLLKEGWDFGHLDEIYLHKVYGEKFSGTVIDVGASNGDSSVFFAKRGADMVIALEPYPESYRLAQRNVELNGLTHKIKLVNAALASGRGRIKLKVSTKSPNANSLDPTCKVLRMGINFDLEVEVPSLTLQDIFDEYDLERVSLLKMDCEGCEYNVLRNMDKAIFEKIDAVVLEYHNGAQDIPNILVDNGFKPGYNNSPVGLLYATKTSFKK